MPGQRLSSTALSMISHTQCINPRESVDPMYARTLTDSIQALKDRQCIGGVRGGFVGTCPTLEPGYDNYV